MSLQFILKLVAWIIYSLLTATPNGVTPPPVDPPSNEGK